MRVKTHGAADWVRLANKGKTLGTLREAWRRKRSGLVKVVVDGGTIHFKRRIRGVSGEVDV